MNLSRMNLKRKKENHRDGYFSGNISSIFTDQDRIPQQFGDFFPKRPVDSTHLYNSSKV